MGDGFVLFSEGGRRRTPRERPKTMRKPKMCQKQMSRWRKGPSRQRTTRGFSQRTTPSSSGPPTESPMASLGGGLGRGRRWEEGGGTSPRVPTRVYSSGEFSLPQGASEAKMKFGASLNASIFEVSGTGTSDTPTCDECAGSPDGRSLKASDGP